MAYDITDLYRKLIMMYFKKQTECVNIIANSVLPGKIKCIFLIGSYAKQRCNINSDVDLIVVSNSFKNINNHVRKKILLSAFQGDYPKLDIICLTEQEFQNYKTSTAYKEEKLILLYEGDHK